MLPFGTPEEVRDMVRERMRIFGAGGGFVFSTIHNAETGIPSDNLVAFTSLRQRRPPPLCLLRTWGSSTWPVAQTITG